MYLVQLYLVAIIKFPKVKYFEINCQKHKNKENHFQPAIMKMLSDNKYHSNFQQ